MKPSRQSAKINEGEMPKYTIKASARYEGNIIVYADNTEQALEKIKSEEYEFDIVNADWKDVKISPWDWKFEER
jgi:hypothetical protein